MIQSKGRCSLKQYVPLKPTKRGYKIWILIESAAELVYNFEIYTEKNTKRHIVIERVCMDDTNTWSESKITRHLFFDSYFDYFIS